MAPGSRLIFCINRANALWHGETPAGLVTMRYAMCAVEISGQAASGGAPSAPEPDRPSFVSHTQFKTGAPSADIERRFRADARASPT